MRVRGVAVVIPTFRRESEVTEQASRFSAMKVVVRVIVVDQGATLAGHKEFQRLLSSTEKIELVVQPNLGGSGGYARGMLELLDNTEDAVLLSDDDAVLTEEVLNLMVEYQRRVPQPTIVGTGMRSAEEPDILVSQSEYVSERKFVWGPADGLSRPLRLGGDAVLEKELLRLRTEPNYCGWWGALLPPGTINEVGLPAPYFLKWDDAEYGLRATSRGYLIRAPKEATVVHPTWGAYKTQMTWVARLLHRNRLATAAVYGVGRGVIVSSLSHQFKHVLAGHHLTAELWSAGIEQFLAGPSAWLGIDLLDARMAGQRVVDEWNRTRRGTNRSQVVWTSDALGLARAVTRALIGILAPKLRRRRFRQISADKLTWRSTLGEDFVQVLDADGNVAVELTWSKHEARRLLRVVLRQHWVLWRKWRKLTRWYEQALPETTSVEAWLAIIGDAENEAR